MKIKPSDIPLYEVVSDLSIDVSVFIFISPSLANKVAIINQFMPDVKEKRFWISLPKKFYLNTDQIY